MTCADYCWWIPLGGGVQVNKLNSTLFHCLMTCWAWSLLTFPLPTIKRLISPSGTITVCLCPLFVFVGPRLSSAGGLCAELAGVIWTYGPKAYQGCLTGDMQFMWDGVSGEAFWGREVLTFWSQITNAKCQILFLMHLRSHLEVCKSAVYYSYTQTVQK